MWHASSLDDCMCAFAVPCQSTQCVKCHLNPEPDTADANILGFGTDELVLPGQAHAGDWACARSADMGPGFNHCLGSVGISSWGHAMSVYIWWLPVVKTLADIFLALPPLARQSAATGYRTKKTYGYSRRGSAPGNEVLLVLRLNPKP